MRRLLLVLALIVLLPVAGLALGAIPVPARGSDAPLEGERYAIYVISNGFHSAIALPADVPVAVPGQPDESSTVLTALGIEAADLPVDPNLVRYWQFGWGSKTAYTSLRAVSDLTVGIAARALAFDVSVMHVQPLGALATGPGVYRLDLSSGQLDALVASIAPYFRGSEPIAEITQGFGDRFYPGAGRFSPIKSCNTWTGRRLRAAGVAVGTWTPVAATLEFGLARAQAR